MTLAHPPAEDLGRFAEGTLDDAGRAAIVTHIADCDECRVVVVDATEFVEPVAVRSDRWRWMSVAAATFLVVGGAGFLFYENRDPLAKVTDAYGQLKNRPIETRLSGVAYVPRITMRGANDETDLPLMILQGEAETATALRGENAKTLHARGVGFLLIGKPDEAISMLQAAVSKEQNNPRYLNDLAAALIVVGKRDLQKASEATDRPNVSKPKEYVEAEHVPSDQPILRRALTICDKVIQIDPVSPEALFNRAKALELLGPREDVIKAYDRYLAVDSSSGWAGEIRQSLDFLQSSPPAA
jgi:tetratricopeptide (TPR) repeat protein